MLDPQNAEDSGVGLPSRAGSGRPARPNEIAGRYGPALGVRGDDARRRMELPDGRMGR